VRGPNRPGARSQTEASEPFEGLSLVILAGKKRSTPFAVLATPQLLGRSPEAPIRVGDPRISRAHADVTAVSGGVRFQCRPDAAPILVAGVETRDGVAAPGQQVVVGETVFEVVVTPPAEESTELRTLLTGPANDVRGLLAILALTETLDAASSRADVPARLAAWGEQHVRASRVRIVEDGALADRVIVRHGHRGAEDEETVVLVPAHAELGVGIELTLEKGGDAPSVLRLLGVVGRLCGSTLARLDALEAIERERGLLRKLAVGSARAFLGESPAAATVTNAVARLAASDATGLLEGETGVGKTFVARLIHEAGARAQAPLQVVNCAAIPENLVESELFGHERGAFTGAVAARAGVFESAGRGTVLLDEIGELPLASQSKLLHVLEDKRFTPVGSTRSVPLAARVLAATNRDLEAMVQEGTFRRDLFFRLSVVRVAVPPLRDRGDDLVLLAQHILDDLRASSARRVEGFTDEALHVIRTYAWPGNVRELRNVLEHALVMGDGKRIGVLDLPAAVRAVAAAASPRVVVAASAPAAAGGSRTVELPASLEWLEKQAIGAALAATSGNQKQAAAILGINRVTLYKKLKAAPE
jgi:DNA-binding NtrC family response regulator